MLEAIKDLGEMVLKKEKKDRLSIFVENINSNGRYNTCLAIMLKENDGEFQYDNVEEEPFSIEKRLKYLYRSGKGNGPGFSPTAKLTEAKKTFNMKILGWFKILNANKLNISEEDKNFLLKTKSALEKNSEEIIKAIQEKRNQKPRKESIFLTLKFWDGFDEKYIGDYDIFRTLFLKGVDSKDLKIYAENKVCSICKEKKPLVVGNLDIYKFYTIDKPGFISGGFKDENAWKNFPVCLDCKQALEEGKKYIQENLSFDFAGLKYQLIPKILFGSFTTAGEVLSLLERIKSNSLGKDQKNVYLADEKEILVYLKDEKDNISLNFLFIKQIQSAERIQLLLEDVFPSRLKKIFTAKEKVEDVFGGGEQFTFWTLRTFFFKSDENKRYPDLDKYFFELTEKIFKNRKIDKDFLMNFFMKKIRKDFITDDFFKSSVKRALMDVMFLDELSLLENKEEIMDEGLFDDLFEKYGATFASPIKRGLFLLGALTELLLWKQYTDRGATPFMKNLKGLKMEERDFKGLLPKVQNKFEEYESFDKRERSIVKEAADYLLKAGDKWKIGLDEMNFYFASGMDLAEEVTRVVYKNK